MKGKWLIIFLVVIFLLNLAVVYFGRIHYPENFQPETVTFLENYLVINMMVAGILFATALFLGITALIIKIWKGEF
jgi:hypothetical protein